MARIIGDSTDAAEHTLIAALFYAAQALSEMHEYNMLKREMERAPYDGEGLHGQTPD